MTEPMGILIDQLRIEVEAARSKGMKLWEERLQLWIRPRPNWMPSATWNWIIGLVLNQHHFINQEKAMGGQNKEGLANQKKGLTPAEFLGPVDPAVSAIKLKGDFHGR